MGYYKNITYLPQYIYVHLQVLKSVMEREFYRGRGSRSSPYLPPTLAPGYTHSGVITHVLPTENTLTGSYRF